MTKVTFDVNSKGDVKERIKSILSKGSPYPVENIKGQDVPRNIKSPYRGLYPQDVIKKGYKQYKDFASPNEAYLNANNDFDSYIDTICKNCGDIAKINNNVVTNTKKVDINTSYLSPSQHAQMINIYNTEEEAKKNILESSKLLFVLREKVKNGANKLTPRDKALEKLQKINTDQIKNYRKQTKLYVKELRKLDRVLIDLNKFSLRLSRVSKHLTDKAKVQRIVKK